MSLFKNPWNFSVIQQNVSSKENCIHYQNVSFTFIHMEKLGTHWYYSLPVGATLALSDWTERKMS